MSAPPILTNKASLHMGRAPWRDEAFDALLNEEYPPVDVYGQVVNIAEALATNPVAYARALHEWRAQQRDELNDVVVITFPLPVAHCYKRFLKGNREPAKRLRAAQDCWEAIIHLLHALVLGELRAIDGVVEGRNIKREWLDSHTLRERIEVFRRVQDWAGAELPVSFQVPPRVSIALQKLNDGRNSRAHRGELTDVQTQNAINEAERELTQVLNDLRWLTGARLIQPVSFKQGRVFAGHSADQEFQDLHLSDLERVTVAERKNCRDEVFFQYDGHLFSVSPVIVPIEDPESHQAHLAYLKQRKGERLIHEIFGRAKDIEFKEPQHLIDLNALKQRFVND